MVDILTRDQWGARAPLGPAMALPVRELWLHHSVTTPTGDPAADMRQLERIGVERFGRFSYSWAVHPDGPVMEGAGLTVGAHTGGRNSKSFGIVWIGNYAVDHPTPAQLYATAELIRWLMAAGHLWPGVYPTSGHRDAPGASTACPGDFGYDALPYLRTLVVDGVPDLEEEDDMAMFESPEQFVEHAGFGAMRALEGIGLAKPDDVVQVVAYGVERALAGEAAKALLVRYGIDAATSDEAKTVFGADVDEAALASHLLAVLSPEAIAAAIPETLAQDVADVLAERLAD